MDHKNDILLSQLTVKIVNLTTGRTSGSGVIYSSSNLRDKLYILTAAHCLYHKANTFEIPMEKVGIELYNISTNSYQNIIHVVNYDTVNQKEDEDVAVLVLDKSTVESVIGRIPNIKAVKERQTVTNYVIKGFPNATLGEELDSIKPVWSQTMTGSHRFQLRLFDDYSAWNTQGFSGSGVFLYTNKTVYLFGIFTRFRKEGQGKVIYCQYIETINQILDSNYLPLIKFTFLSEYGLTPDFFSSHVKKAVKNLGPRFNEKLNFRLPIVQEFHDLCRDPSFKVRLLKCLDDFLLSHTSYPNGKNNILEDIEKQYAEVRKWIMDWIPTLVWEPDKLIDIVPLTERISTLDKELDKTLYDVYRLQAAAKEEDEAKGIKRDYRYNPPYSSEISNIRDMSKNCRDLTYKLDDINFNLANSPYLIIKGEAGCGKSHLLGDIATKWDSEHKIVILLLGQLFKKEKSIWENILSQIDHPCTKDEFLESYNSIGRQLGLRVLILIDALNEGDGKDVWNNELSGLIAEIAQFPFIGLVLTVRTTYWNVIIPEEIRRDPNIFKLEHEGFRGNEYAALHLFCEHYSLQQPNFPILAPEFTNPLFLQLVCTGVKAAGEKSFPKGFSGFSQVFTYYLNALATKLSVKRPEYKLRSKLALQAIQLVSDEIFSQDTHRYLTVCRANDLFDVTFPKFPFLLADLIEENVFIQNLFTDYDTNTEVEGIYFAYERIGDYYITDKLLAAYTDRKMAKEACSKTNTIGRLTIDGYWKNRGIIEALSIILPERFNLEIFEAFDWLFTLKSERKNYIDGESLNYTLLNSLKWRNPDSINKDKILEWFRGKHFRIHHDQVYLKLVELTTYIDHPFNSDFFHNNLLRHPMGIRDSFWQQHLYYYNGTFDDGNAMPVNRLIDWAWQENLSSIVDGETARLAGQTLAWILVTTNRQLRDQVTKAMVNLLQEQPDALIAILKAFEGIDDLYILERLYAVALGCSLRTTNVSSLAKISAYTYDNIFKDGKPPLHILLRDYARNIVEYAIFKQVDQSFDEKLIQPPYDSKMPENMPTEKDIRRYSRDYKSSAYKKSYSHEFNQIKHSVMDWDFGRYTIESALRRFSAVSFVQEKEIVDFIKKLPAPARKWLKLFIKFNDIVIKLSSSKYSGFSERKVADGMTMEDSLNQDLKKIRIQTERLLDEQQALYLNNHILPFLESKRHQATDNFTKFPTTPIKRWIVQRAHNLGYDEKIHGPYDSSVEGYSTRIENKVERVGKKYQWLAFYEIMAMITDNFKLGQDWGNSQKYDFYQGPWQMYLRDVDPVFISKNSENEDGNDELGITQAKKHWWLDSDYNYWEQDDQSWARNPQDLPNPLEILQRKDSNGDEWVYLNLHVTWKQPKIVGKDRYRSKRKEIWYMFQGYLVAKKDKSKIKNWLSKQNFRGRWLPESHSPTGLFNREHYWSPASKNYQKEAATWTALDNNSHKVIISTNQAVGEMSDDQSGAHFNYNIPCKQIFEGMNLQYAGIDGDLNDVTGKLVVTNINPKGTLIRKVDFINYLQKHNLDIIWTLLGEKRVLNADFSRIGNYFATLSGVYSLEGTILQGAFTLTEDE